MINSSEYFIGICEDCGAPLSDRDPHTVIPLKSIDLLQREDTCTRCGGSNTTLLAP